MQIHWGAMDWSPTDKSYFGFRTESDDDDDDDVGDDNDDEFRATL